MGGWEEKALDPVFFKEALKALAELYGGVYGLENQTGSLTIGKPTHPPTHPLTQLLF